MKIRKRELIRVDSLPITVISASAIWKKTLHYIFGKQHPSVRQLRLPGSIFCNGCVENFHFALQPGMYLENNFGGVDVTIH